MMGFNSTNIKYKAYKANTRRVGSVSQECKSPPPLGEPPVPPVLSSCNIGTHPLASLTAPIASSTHRLIIATQSAASLLLEEAWSVQLTNAILTGVENNSPFWRRSGLGGLLLQFGWEVPFNPGMRSGLQTRSTINCAAELEIDVFT